MRSVRNFWLSAHVDGRATPVETGPRGSGGGFTQVIYIRGEGGDVVTAVRVTGEAFSDGELRLFVEPGEASYRTPDGKILPDSVTVEPYGDGGFKITSKR